MKTVTLGPRGIYNLSVIGTWISVVGSIASIGGAIWAFVQARRAVGAASTATRARDEIIERRKIVEVSQVHSETNKILRVASKVGPSCNERQLQGLDCGEIAREIEEYARFLNEHSSHFTDLFENQAKELCEKLFPDIEKLSEAMTFEEKKSAGKNIYQNINTFLPFVKDLSDDKKERVPTR